MPTYLAFNLDWGAWLHSGMGFVLNSNNLRQFWRTAGSLSIHILMALVLADTVYHAIWLLTMAIISWLSSPSLLGLPLTLVASFYTRVSAALLGTWDFHMKRTASVVHSCLVVRSA